MVKEHKTFEKPGLVVSYKLGVTRVFRGALVGLDEEGWLYPMMEKPSLRFVGVAHETIDNSAGPEGFKSVNVSKTGSFVYHYRGEDHPLQSLIGLEAYACTGDSVTCDVVFGKPVGNVIGIEPTENGRPGVRIRIDLFVC